MGFLILQFGILSHHHAASRQVGDAGWLMFLGRPAASWLVDDSTKNERDEPMATFNFSLAGNLSVCRGKGRVTGVYRGLAGRPFAKRGERVFDSASSPRSSIRKPNQSLFRKALDLLDWIGRGILLTTLRVVNNTPHPELLHFGTRKDL